MVLRPNPSYANSNMQEQSGDQSQSYYDPSEQEYSSAEGSRGLNDTYYGAQQHQGDYSQGGYVQEYPPQQQDPVYGQEAYSAPSYGQPIPSYAPSEQSEPYNQYTPSNASYPPYSPPPNDPYAQTPEEARQYGESDPAVPPNPGEPQTDEERGLMGALAGGLAGGYAGHKMHHGFLGTVGGAYAGHKLEEAYKQHHNKPQTPQAPAVPYGSHPGHGHQQPVSGYAAVPGSRGNFSTSARNITLDKDFDLIASLRCVNGSERLSSISLNNVLTNDNGHFRWVKEGGNFAASAREVHISQPGQGPLELRAELRTVDGRWQRASVRLDEEIENHDGDLRLA
jgi:hypothetical protein